MCNQLDITIHKKKRGIEIVAPGGEGGRVKRWKVREGGSGTDSAGLLVSPKGTVILSTTHQETFARLEPRYQAAAEAGLCFWWKGGTLVRILDSEAFLERVRSLPSLTDRVWCAERAAHRRPNLL